MIEKLVGPSVWAAAITLGSAQQSVACSVCYGATESPIMDGARLSVLFLLALTYFVIVGGLLGFYLIRRKVGRHEGVVARSG